MLVDFNERYMNYEPVFWTAGRYTGLNGKSVWITDTVWEKKKKNLTGTSGLATLTAYTSD